MKRLFLLALAGCGSPDLAVKVAPEPEPSIAKPGPPRHLADDGWEGTPLAPPRLRDAFQAVPPGFPAKDAYESHDEACLAVVAELVPPRWRRPILMWCEHRVFHSSRGGTVVSKVDGSQIHDRDRPTAWVFYEVGIANGHLDPGCPFHQIRRSIRHPAECRRLARDWPFRSPRMTERLRTQWLKHSHDMERFGARGPIDWNANAFRHIPGCWDPAQLDRFDVSVTALVRAALAICEEHGCSSKHEIKAHWGRRG